MCYGLTWSRHFTGFDEKSSIFNFVAVLEQAALGRSRGARTVLVIGSAVTETHKETRLWKPSNRASQVRAVDGKDLEDLIIHPTNPARDVTGLTIPVIDQRISIRSKSSLPTGKLLQPAEREPGVITWLSFASHRRQQVSHYGHG